MVLWCTWRVPAQVSGLMYPAACGWRAAPAATAAPGGTAGRRGAGTSRVYVQTARPGRLRCRPGRVARAARYAALAAVSALVPGSPAASGAGAGGGGEPVGAGLVGDHLRDAEAGQLVQGVGDRACRPGQHLADLVRGEGGVGELAQVLLDQVAQRAGPGRGGAPAAGGGLQRPAAPGRPAPGRSSRAARAAARSPAARAFPASSAAWAMARTFPAASAVTAGSGPARCRLPLPALGGAASGGRGGLAVVRRARRRAARPRWCCPCRGSRRLGPRRPGLPGRRRASRCRGCRAALPLTRVAVPAFSCAIRACRAAAVLIPARPAITATAAPAGSADSAARTAAAGLSPAAGATGAGAGVRRGVGGAAGRVRGGGFWCVP